MGVIDQAQTQADLPQEKFFPLQDFLWAPKQAWGFGELKILIVPRIKPRFFGSITTVVRVVVVVELLVVAQYTSTTNNTW
jgi:hypothetical protein